MLRKLKVLDNLSSFVFLAQLPLALMVVWRKGIKLKAFL